jgi:hypothetical protein
MHEHLREAEMSDSYGYINQWLLSDLDKERDEERD